MRKRLILTILGVAAALILIPVVLLAVAQLVVLFEPVVRVSAKTAPSAYTVVESDERLFTVMAALNAVGYDDENNSDGMHPVRVAVRQRLAGKNLPSLARLRLFRVHPSAYATWALQRTNPPDFSRAADGWWIENVPPLLFFGLDAAMRDFYREADIAGLWREYKPQYDGMAERYREPSPAAVGQVLDYLRISAPPTGRVVVLPNLLDAYWRGYGEHVGDTTYVIMGPPPPENLNLGLIQHEAMHPIVNPLVDANLTEIDAKQTDRLFKWLEPKMSSGYPTWNNILRESVIRAVGIRLLGPAMRERAFGQEESQGFLLVRPLYEKLGEYERTDASFSDYMPTLLKSLNAFQID